MTASGPDSTLAGARWLKALCVGVPVVYAVILALSWSRAGRADYDQFLVFHELQYWNASLFGMAKQWTPVMCGGLSMAGDPQVPFASLSMLLSYVIGPGHGPRLAIVIYLLVGWAGMFLYAGLWIQRRLTRALAAALFIGNGFFLARLCHGHLDLVPFLSLPLVLWSCHRAVAWERQLFGLAGVTRLLLAILLLGAGLGMVVDGAPVAFVHLLVWIGLYVVVLAATARSAAPLVLLAGALVVAAVLDAGYVWPMLIAQREFPRTTADAFTSPLSLIWFMLLPVRGKLIPAPANGHEMSVFIGPIIAVAIWRHRKALYASLTKDLRIPLLVVSAVAIWLGMGSLRPLHVPVWLSPFDLLRPLPGFRSMGVTARNWGFLALPLSLLGAAALVRLASERPPVRRLGTWLGLATLLQLGAQVESVSKHLLISRPYRQVAYREAFTGPEQIDYVACGQRDQGELITPVRGVVDCYDLDDFIRPPMEPGARLVRSVLRGAKPIGDAARLRGEFLTWNRIRILAEVSAPLCSPPDCRAIVQVVLNQAYHPLWSVGAGASLLSGEQGNLTILCSLDRLQRGPLELEFRDPVSDAGARVSAVAWRFFAAACLALLIALLVLRGRSNGKTPA